MLSPPSLTPRHALFLDFDGTLADIAPLPDAVQLAPGLLQDLRALHQALNGALAIVTGRTLADIDHFLKPLDLPLACEHGAHWRLSSAGSATAPSLDLGPVLRALAELTARHPELLIERKSAGVALHYRQAPHLQQACHEALTQAVAQVAGAELMAGKCVYEVKPAGASKGQAITRFLQQPPFAGRMPLFFGDDVTDEAGFAAVQAAGGVGVKVGSGDSAARARMASPASVRAWLHQAARQLTGASAPAKDFVTAPQTAA
ncbi:trehalose-phosphatase [Melaminivora suipulveris]|uniref:Trehalose 6-phosphate phosphatase n=1 Tax=Melaminivora suipulveris TaxID=2109913 RepID=A0A2R3QAU5_9BURK|nr:trehalose-phosphatase [Melaminivora suipulveris]AVO48879.1 trehalose-phosphatase [Melaminivora suipulveris]